MTVFDDIFDRRYLVELAHKLSKEPWYPNNIANRYTWPYGDKGAHKLLGSIYFDRKDLDIIEYSSNLSLSYELIDIYYKIIERAHRKLMLKEIKTNLQFMGMDGANHCDSTLENEVGYILMLSDEDIEPDEGGQFINETLNETVEFKQGRVIEFNPFDEHRGLAFNTPHKCRFSIKFLGTQNLNLEIRE